MELFSLRLTSISMENKAGISIAQKYKVARETESRLIQHNLSKVYVV